jgi:hypothetical protein
MRVMGEVEEEKGGSWIRKAKRRKKLGQKRSKRILLRMGREDRSFGERMTASRNELRMTSCRRIVKGSRRVGRRVGG